MLEPFRFELVCFAYDLLAIPAQKWGKTAIATTQTRNEGQHDKRMCGRSQHSENEATKKPPGWTAEDQIGSGGWNRTNGLQVMSLTSYLCSTPQ